MDADGGVDGEAVMPRDAGVGRDGSESNGVMEGLLPHFAREEPYDALAALFAAVG